MAIFNTAFLTPRNIFVVVLFGVAALWLARKLLKHPATMPPGASDAADAAADEVGDVMPSINLGPQDGI